MVKKSEFENSKPCPRCDEGEVIFKKNEKITRCNKCGAVITKKSYAKMMRVKAARKSFTAVKG